MRRKSPVRRRGFFSLSAQIGGSVRQGSFAARINANAHDGGRTRDTEKGTPMLEAANKQAIAYVYGHADPRDARNRQGADSR